MNYEKANTIYDQNKLKKKGDEITCPVCELKFPKKTYHNNFHSPVCREKFWNDKKTYKHIIKIADDYYDQYIIDESDVGSDIYG